MRPCNYLDRGTMLAGAGGECLTTDELALTYGDVRRASFCIAEELHDAGATAGTKIGVYSPNHPLALVAILGVARAACTYVAVNTANTVADNAAVLRSAGCEILYYHSRYQTQAATLADSVDSLRHIAPLDDPDTAERWFGRSESEGFSTDQLPHSPDDIAYLLPTGGTTGPAKSVMVSNANLEALVANQLTALPECENPVYLVSAPITHGAGIMALGFLATGATIHILDGVNPETVLSTIQEQQVTHLFFPPTAIYKLLAHPTVRDPRRPSVFYPLSATVDCTYRKQGRQVSSGAISASLRLGHMLNLCFLQFTKELEGLEVAPAAQESMDSLEHTLAATSGQGAGECVRSIAE